jgi:hypothetical protein
MDAETLFEKYEDRLEDFWGRREARPRYTRYVYLFGRPLQLVSNQRTLLTAIDGCLPLYSKAAPVAGMAFSIQLVVQLAQRDPGPVPPDLFDQIQYAGSGQWLTILLGAWGHCYVDLAAGKAVAVLTPELAQEPELVSRCLLNTVITNFFISSGYAMLHASCLVRQGRAVLLMAAHNSGKSTTALRMALAGYPLLSDSMVFLPPDEERPQLLGFPVGKIKLRHDMVAAFPQLQSLLTPELVRGETKYSLDLRRVDPSLVLEEAACPEAVDLCLLERGEGERTLLSTAAKPAVRAAIMQNSLFFDTKEVWLRNLSGIQRLVDRSQWHHLIIGSDKDSLVEAVGALWNKV